jgi:hypothetical protein
MAITNGTNLGLAVNGALDDEHYTQLMAQWRGLDGLTQCRVKDKDLTAPPGSPADGDMYIVGPAATGAWATHSGKLTRYFSVGAGAPAWEFYTPWAGWSVRVEDETTSGVPALYVHSGSAWVLDPGGSGGGGGSSAVVDSVSSASGVLTLSGISGETVRVLLNENITSIVYPAGAAGLRKDLLIRFEQDGSGGRTVDLTGVDWDGDGSPPSIASGIGDITYITATNVDNQGWEGFKP